MFTVALAIVFGVIGAAVIVWSKIRDNDPEVIKWIMIIGVASTMAWSIYAVSADDAVMMEDPMIDEPMMGSGAKW